jgi:NTE family protein
MRNLILFLFVLLPAVIFSQQKIGLVLSGGGASGMAHIGVLKALEENNIPIDYITGTSIGALIGGLYASGYSPEEIEGMVTSDYFLDATNGIIDNEYQFYFNQLDENPSMINWNFNLDSTFDANFPTSIVSSIPIDYGLMIYLSGANAASNGNFDSLMIPFRCIATNITDKEQKVFKDGDLASSIRASMTYPFYLTPIEIDGKIMFDGGLKNNFPVDILCEEFNPDFVIASNVSTSIEAPTTDNVLSQIKNLLISDSNFEIDCSDGIIINSSVDDISTFDFEQNNIAIQRGYFSTTNLLDSIKSQIKSSRTKDKIDSIRFNFINKKPELAFEEISFEGLDSKPAKYFRQKVQPNSTSFDINDLTKPYFRLATENKIKSIYPIAKFNEKTNFFKLELKVKKEKNFKASFGGVITTKPFSTGFFQLDYMRLKSNKLDAFGNIYFGRFYNSVKTGLRYDIPFDIPLYFKGEFTINQFDFFNNQATFIDNVDAPYIIYSEQFLSGKIGLPVFNKGKITINASYFWNEFNYYQNEKFNRGDTNDITTFEGYSTAINYELYSLNRKQFATKGEKISFMFRQINGTEKTKPGSTSINKTDFKNDHNWIIIKLAFEKYFLKTKPFHFGILAEGVYSNQPNFQNYTATLLNSPSFSPLPEMKTIFQDKYHAFSFVGAGIKTIYSLNKNIDFRAEAYLFQPYEELNEDTFGSTTKGEEISVRNVIGTFTTVYHSRVGPLAASINYYDDEQTELSFIIHFGYILFNKHSRE